MQWKTTFGHEGTGVTSDVGVPGWAYWERCTSMAQAVNLQFAGLLAVPAADNLPAAGIPKAGVPMVDALGASYDGDITSHGLCPPDYEPEMG